jgi:integrase
VDLKKPWDRIRAHAGLDGLRLHDLRHSFAAVGAGSGLGLPTIGKLLGHKEVSTTARYAHLADDPVKRAANSIADSIAAALKGNGLN